MPGTLHISRLKTDPLQYQANYNLGTRSYLHVFDAAGMEHFLQHYTTLPVGEVNTMLNDLRSGGHTSEAIVDLSETHLAEMGFTESPSDQ
jgi:hypothetical protein